MKEQAVDAAIILASDLTDEMILDVSRDGFPIVLLDRELQGPEMFNICIDNFEGAYAATKHLIDEAYENIACIQGPDVSYDAENRFKGFCKAMRDHHKMIDNDLIVRSDFTEKGGYETMLHLLDERKLNAVFCLNDEMAIGAIKAVQDKALRIPEDVAIIGFDDIILSSYIQPSLSTVSHPNYEWGIEAGNCVFEALEGSQETKMQILSTKLILRNSSSNDK